VNAAAYPHVRGYSLWPLDLSAVITDPANVLLAGEHRAILFQQLQFDLYEAHSQCLLDGRGTGC
jgi:hypothetical protein